MIRAKLIEAREKSGWTQEWLAERIGVDVATIRRWEHGEVSPQGRNKWKLVEALEVSSEDDLGLGRKVAENPASTLNSLVRHSCVAGLLTLIFSSNDGVLELQCTIRQSLEGLTMDISRREALYTLAALPLAALSSMSIEKSADELLRRSAAGIAACEQLSKGCSVDMHEASKALASYLPALKIIVNSSSSSKYRILASTLITQIYIRKAVLAVHLVGTRQTVGYARQAVDYAQESSNAALLISSLVWHAWALFCDGQMKSAMNEALQTQYIVEHTDGLSALAYSSVHAVAAKYQALNGYQYRDCALQTLQQARNNFEAANQYNDQTIYLDYSLDVLTLIDAMVHYYTGDPVSAYEILSKVIDPDSLEPKIELSSERLKIEAINDLTLFSLKLPGPKKDKERSLKLWHAGLQGAIDLHSEQRLNETTIAQHIMEALWEDDEEIKELRQLIVHW